MYRNSKYIIVNKELQEETIHHETSGKQVKLFDESMNEIGNLNGVLNGKDMGQTEVDIMTLKYSGSYIVRKMKNPPKPIDKSSILQVFAVGEIGAPDFVHFTIIYPSGDVFDNTVVGSKESGWSSGGQTLKQSLDTTNKNVDANAVGIKTNKDGLAALKTSHDSLSTKLDTTNKNVATNADGIKTNKDGLAALKASHVSLSTKHDGHNHDTRYLKLSGGNVTGNIGLQYGASYSFVSAQGERKNFATYSVAGGAVLGDASVVLEIKSKDSIKHNGKKLWSEVNDGKGSGLDADKIHGVDGSYVVSTNKVNRFKEELYIDNGKSVSFQSSGASSGVYWLNNNGAVRSSIRSSSDGSIQFYGNGGEWNTKVDGSGNLISYKSIYFNSSLGENRTVYQLNGTDKGMGFYRNTSSKYLGVYDWQRSVRLAYFDEVNGSLYLDQSPYIKGRRLHLQSATPTGSHSVGDVWIS